MKENLEIWKPSYGEIESVRKTFKTRMEKLYNGWNNEYDKQWDRNSFLFALKQKGADSSGFLPNNKVEQTLGQKNDVFTATCRIVIKRYNNFEFTTPMEQADISFYKLPEYYGNCCEGGMVSFSSIGSMKTLMFYVCNWLIENNFDYITTCYDVKNPLMKRLYINTLEFENVENAILKYSGFTSKKNSGLVKWQVVEANLKKQAKFISDKLSKDSKIEYKYKNYPTVQDWLNTYNCEGKGFK